MKEKTDLINFVAQTYGLSIKDSREIINGIFEEITREVVSGEGYRIIKFGTFTKRVLHNRKGRNMKTGEYYAERDVPTGKFTASRYIKELLKVL